MAELDTCPTPISIAVPRHEHAWVTDSRHATSEGVLVYVRCSGCRAHRVDLEAHPTLPPTALTREFERTD